MEDFWGDSIVIGLLVVLIVLFVSCGVLQSKLERAERDCRAAGYVDRQRWNGEEWCVGMRDGQPYLVPLEAVRAEK